MSCGKSTKEMLNEAFNKKGYEVELFNEHSGTGYYALKISEDDLGLNWKHLGQSYETCMRSVILEEDY